MFFFGLLQSRIKGGGLLYVAESPLFRACKQQVLHEVFSVSCDIRTVQRSLYGPHPRPSRTPHRLFLHRKFLSQNPVETFHSLKPIKLILENTGWPTGEQRMLSTLDVKTSIYILSTQTTQDLVCLSTLIFSYSHTEKLKPRFQNSGIIANIHRQYFILQKSLNQKLFLFKSYLALQGRQKAEINAPT